MPGARRSGSAGKAWPHIVWSQGHSQGAVGRQRIQPGAGAHAFLREALGIPWIDGEQLRRWPRPRYAGSNRLRRNLARGHASEVAGSSLLLVHHASKGTQSGKAVTDVGAGAGAQSRATDTHLVLRPHQEDDCVVAEAVVRSWPPVAPRCLRWQFPLWEPDDTLDPEALRQERPRKRKDETPQEPPWTAERFAAEFLGPRPQTRASILLRATQAGLSERKATTLLRGAEAIGMAFRLPGSARDQAAYSSTPREASQ